MIYPHLLDFGIITFVQQWFTNRDKGTKGGGKKYSHVQDHLNRWIKQEGANKDVYFSVMIDLYAFPKDDQTAYDEEIRNVVEPIKKVQLLEGKIALRTNFHRFIPDVQLHEFEALILSDPMALENYFYSEKANIEKLYQEVKDMAPETINETPDGAPSKRIEKYIPQYKDQKATAGPIVTEKIGLQSIRMNCPHFNEWINKLEALA